LTIVGGQQKRLLSQSSVIRGNQSRSRKFLRPISKFLFILTCLLVVVLESKPSQVFYITVKGHGGQRFLPVRCLVSHLSFHHLLRCRQVHFLPRTEAGPRMYSSASGSVEVGACMHRLQMQNSITLSLLHVRKHQLPNKVRYLGPVMQKII
jgi:hypothetical protein